LALRAVGDPPVVIRQRESRVDANGVRVIGDGALDLTLGAVGGSPVQKGLDISRVSLDELRAASNRSVLIVPLSAVLPEVCPRRWRGDHQYDGERNDAPHVMSPIPHVHGTMSVWQHGGWAPRAMPWPLRSTVYLTRLRVTA